MRILYTLSLISLLAGVNTLQGNEQIETITDKISDIFPQIVHITSSGISQEVLNRFQKSMKDDINAIQTTLSQIDIDAFQTWCRTKEKSKSHPMVTLIFRPFYAGISGDDVRNWYARYTQTSLDKAIEIANIIHNQRPETLKTTRCIAQDFISTIERSTLDAFDEIALSANPEKAYRQIHEKLRQLMSHVPIQTWHYQEAGTTKTPLDACIEQIDTRVQPIHLIKAIVQVTPKDILNQKAYLHYAQDILANIKISSKELKNNPGYLTTTAETLDILLKKQPDLVKNNNIELWPIYSFTDNILELEKDNRIKEKLRDSIHDILDVLYQHGGNKQFTTPDPDNNRMPINASDIINTWNQQKTTDPNDKLRSLYHHVSYLEQLIRSR